jgi:hypothetical protein
VQKRPTNTVFESGGRATALQSGFAADVSGEEAVSSTRFLLAQCSIFYLR